MKYGDSLTEVLSAEKILLVLLIASIVVAGSAVMLNVKHDNHFREAPKVLFDFTKHEDAGNADWRIDGAYSSWADALRDAGFSVDAIGTGSGEIKYSDLEAYDVFIVPEPQNEFSDSERNAIVEFVENGGTLIYIADHKNSDRDSDGWDSWSIWNENLDFDSTFNITLNDTESGSGSNNEVTDIEDVPILTENVSSFGTWAGTTMKIRGNAVAVAYQTINSKRLPVLAYSNYGKGKVLVHCDSSTFDDGTSDSQNKKDKLYDAWTKYDDATLAVNFVRWATGYENKGNQSTLKSYAGLAPSVSYGDSHYIVAYYSGKSVLGYFVNSTGVQGKEIMFFKYAKGIKTAYNEDGDNFTVVGYDYSPPNYHSILMRFVNPESENSTHGITITEDATNRSAGVIYGNHRILFVWINFSRAQVEGRFYYTTTGTWSANFTIVNDEKEKSWVAVGYDSSLNKFLVVWIEDGDIRGRFVNGNGSLGDYITFPSTTMSEYMLSISGGDGEFMLTYRSGSFSNANGAYFRIVKEHSVSSQYTISDYNANYCGPAVVRWYNGQFLVFLSDARNGNPDVFLYKYDEHGNLVNSTVIANTSANEEAPSGAMGDGGMLVAWCNYASGSKNVEARFYRNLNVPEMSPVALLLAVILLFAHRKFSQLPS